MIHSMRELIYKVNITEVEAAIWVKEMYMKIS